MFLESSSVKHLGKLIKRIRNTNNLTQFQFGKLFQPQVAQSSVARWEKGQQIPNAKHFLKIASLLDVSFEELLEMLKAPVIDTNRIRIKNTTITYNKRHLAILKKGRKAWNNWREKNFDIIPQLSGIDLSSIQFGKLQGYNLNFANLAEVKGVSVCLDHAHLLEANLEKANFKESSFKSAYLTKANLKNIILQSTTFRQANLKNSNLEGALISQSNFQEANLEEAIIQKAGLVNVDFSKAILKKANLSNSKLSNLDFRESNLNEASLENTTITNCDVYGVAFLGIKHNGAKLKEVYVSPKRGQGVTINNLSTAQITYFRHYHPSIIEEFIEDKRLEQELSIGEVGKDNFFPLDHKEFIKLCNVLTRTQVLVYLWIKTRQQNNQELISINTEKIGEDLSITRRTVQRCLIALKEKKFIFEEENKYNLIIRVKS